MFILFLKLVYVLFLTSSLIQNVFNVLDTYISTMKYLILQLLVVFITLEATKGKFY